MVLMPTQSGWSQIVPCLHLDMTLILSCLGRTGSTVTYTLPPTLVTSLRSPHTHLNHLTQTLYQLGLLHLDPCICLVHLI